MPIYEYKCRQCGLILEKIQKTDDVPLITCEECHKDTLEKQISSNTNFHLKGKGWYNTGGY